MAALNGVSIYEWTGVRIPFLPQFPMETWNFRIVHIAGALVLGFLLFAAYAFSLDGKPRRETRILSFLSIALLAPALLAGYTALGFAALINSGELPQMGGLTTWASFPGTEVYAQEIYRFGIPLLIATGGAIVIGWFERRDRALFASSDIVLALCAVVVAVYLIAIYGTAARNAVGTPFVPIGVAFAATAGIGDDPRTDAPRRGPCPRGDHRRLSRLHLHRASSARHPGGADPLYLAALLRPCLFRRWHPWSDRGGVIDLHHPLHHLRGLPAGLESGRLLRQLRLRRRRTRARRPGQGGDLRQRPDGHDQRHLGGQRGRDGLADHPADEEGRLSPENRRCGRGRGLDRWADHAADHGGRRLHHGRDHGHPLPGHRHRRDHPRDPLLRVGLLHGRLRGGQARHARDARGRTAQAARDGAASLPVPAHPHPDRRPVHGLFGDPRGHAGHRVGRRRQLADPSAHGAAVDRSARSSLPGSCRSRSSRSAPVRASSWA